VCRPHGTGSIDRSAPTLASDSQVYACILTHPLRRYAANYGADEAYEPGERG
jgi:hypothetical protein